MVTTTTTTTTTATDARGGLRPGGWTGTLVVTWAAFLLVAGAVVAALLAQAVAWVELFAADLDGRAAEHGIPAEDYRGAVDVVVESVRSATGLPVQWSVIIATSALVLLVAGLRLVAGGPWARRLVRLLLAVVVTLAIAAGLHLSASVLDGSDERAALVGAALEEIWSLTGTAAEERDAVDAILDGSAVTAAVWLVPALVALPSLGLWWLTGRARLRAWCDARAAARRR